MKLTRHDFIWPREKAFFAHSEKVILIADADVFFPPTFLYSVKTECILRRDLQNLLLFNFRPQKTVLCSLSSSHW